MRGIRFPVRGLVGLGVFGLSLALYMATAAPGLTWRNDSADGGELAAAAWTLGVAHPTGYPTYLLLARGFAALLPWLDVAYRLSLFSAIAAALSAFLIFLLLERVLARLGSPGSPQTLRYGVAGVSAVTIAASPLLWSQATVTEVYALNALFFVAVAALSWELLDNPRVEAATEAPSLSTAPRLSALPASGLAARGRLPLAALLLGLGMGNHVILGFLAPVLAWLYFTPSYRRWRLSLLLIACFAVGLGVYLYLPLRAAAGPPINWSQANTWEGFWWLVSGDPYRRFVVDVSQAELFRRVVDWAGLLVEQFTLVGVGVGFLGLWFLLERWSRLLWATLALGLAYSVYAIGYGSRDSYVYLIPFFILFGLWMGVGWWGLFTQVLRSSQWAAGGLIVLMAGVPLFNVAANYDHLDLSKDVEAREFAAGVFREAPDGSLVLANSDAHVFSLWYQRYVEEPDSRVVVVATPLLQFQWYWDQLRRLSPAQVPSQDPGSWEGRMLALVEANQAKGGVYLTYEEATVKERYPLVPQGTLFRVGAPEG
ncbi:MAG: DUF2723 domain-containing protein [Dehalococcoidia bacterium]|nr:DUF2723 domain-containing protein [Dehalococcoidia bacterium]